MQHKLETKENPSVEHQGTSSLLFTPVIRMLHTETPHVSVQSDMWDRSPDTQQGCTVAFHSLCSGVSFCFTKVFGYKRPLAGEGPLLALSAMWPRHHS